MYQRLKRLTSSLLLLLIALTASITFGQASSPSPRPDAPPYAQHGTYAVGVMGAQINTTSERPLSLHVWYPAQAPEGETTPAIPATYLAGFIPVRTGTSSRDATPDTTGAPYPLVVFSHGSGSLPWFSLFLIEHLASRGFVVIGVEHFTNTAIDRVLDADSFRAALIPNYVYRLEDIQHTLDYAESLAQSDSPLAQMVDLERVAVMGHSFGGYTALAISGGQLNLSAMQMWCKSPMLYLLDLPDMNFERVVQTQSIGEDNYYGLCNLFTDAALTQLAQLRGYEVETGSIPGGVLPPISDSRIDAVIAYAPWNAPIFGEDGLANLTIPSLIIVGSGDQTTPAERDAYAFYQHIGSVDKTLVVFDHADHNIFIDICNSLMTNFSDFSVCSDPVWDMARAHDLINHLTTAFLSDVLLGDIDAAQALTPQLVQFPGVFMATTR